jgi:hypothetical protein
MTVNSRRHCAACSAPERIRSNLGFQASTNRRAAFLKNPASTTLTSSGEKSPRACSGRIAAYWPVSTARAAWKETHVIDGVEQEVIVHRKGATPAGPGVLGVIPGSMASPGYAVRSKGNPASLHSASHGAGRFMSRTKALQSFTWSAVKKQLAERGVELLSAGLDEVPGVYKDLEQVMAAQTDLVDILGRFDPRIVKMCPAGEKAED